MGLKVWLPLNGDLHNQGCHPFTITAIEAAPVFVPGKIGQCYQRTNSSTQSTNGLKIENNLLDIFGSTASISVWVKPLGTHTHYNGTIISSGNWNAKKWAFGVSQDNTKVDVLCGSYNTYIDCSVPVNEWTHLVSVYDNGTCKLYKNGIYIGQLTNQKAFETDANWTGICRETYASGYFGFNGCINDLRIYDHCLSLAEIQEISQGLVLHYKLDTITNLNNNLYIGSQNFTNTWVNNSNWTTADETYQNLTVKQRSGTWGGLAQNISCTNGDIFTISFYAKVDSGGQIMSVHRSSLGNVTTGLTILDGNFINSTNWIRTTDNGTQWKRYWATLQINSSDITYLQWRIENNQSGKNLYIAGMKMEKGYGTKIWSLAPSETTISSILQDSSGYNHTGSSINTVNIFSGSPRYSTSINLPDGNSAINCGRGGMITDALTINMWIKTSVASTPCSCKASAGWDFHFNNNALVFSVRINNTDKSVTVNDIRNTICNDEWHMLTGVIGPTMQIYIDSILKQETNIGTPITINYDSSNVLWIGAGASGSATVIGSNGMTGLFSDFRIYCTALNSDAIRQLYNVGAKIDNLQELHSFEVIEDKTMNTIQITKYGQIKCKEMIEGNNSLLTPFQNVQFKSTGVKSNKLLEI